MKMIHYYSSVLFYLDCFVKRYRELKINRTMSFLGKGLLILCFNSLNKHVLGFRAQRVLKEPYYLSVNPSDCDCTVTEVFHSSCMCK